MSAAKSDVGEFIAALRADPRLAHRAEGMALALSEIDFCANSVAEAAAFYESVEWILQQQRSVKQKLEAIDRLNLSGRSASMSMRELTGWQ
jgi:hypothetical protein